jgi:exopolyphosphatase / guanosine-5'-triphosphate,3'-diphosphate pyrophosphatase
VRIAVVDVGTNTTRLYIAEVAEGRMREELVRISRVTRLGAGVDATGRLADDALEREYAVLADYRRQIDSLQPERAVAVMTSAVRDAANGAEFAKTVADRYGLDTHVITGDEEAALTYRGATDVPGARQARVQADKRAHTDGRAQADRQTDVQTLVFDIGGGSTELVIGHGPALDFHVSTQAGVVRQADRHIHSDPPSASELDAVARDVRAILAAAVPEGRRGTVGRAIGVAGTPTSLAAIVQRLDPYDPARVHGYRLTATQRDQMFRTLAAMPLEQRRRVPGLHPDRAIAILPGIVILTEVMNLFGLDAFEVSENDILRGAALTYSA